jgi:hypothetical protein
VVVAKSGGDYTTVTDAMNAISPTVENRYLVLVMPGAYEEQVTLKQYIHLKGAGTGVTVITSEANTNNFNDDAAATMIVPANVHISDLWVRNNSDTNDGVAMKIANGNENTILRNVKIETTNNGGDQHIALYLNSGSPQLNHVLVKVDGGTFSNWGIFNSASAPVIHDSTVNATGTSVEALRLNGGGPTITDSTISGTNGTNGKGITASSAGNDIYIDRSTIEGDLGAQGQSIFNNQNFDFFVGVSLLKGAVLVTDNNRIACYDAYDENYLGLNADCQ